jgi:hypothetical protein
MFQRSWFHFKHYFTKAKAVPIHATKAPGWRGVQLLLILNLGIRWGWVVSVTHRPRIAPGKETPVFTVQEAGWAPEPVWTQKLEEKSFRPCRGSNLDCPVVQPVAWHYTLSYLGSHYFTKLERYEKEDWLTDERTANRDVKLWTFPNVFMEQNRIRGLMMRLVSVISRPASCSVFMARC